MDFTLIISSIVAAIIAGILSGITLGVSTRVSNAIASPTKTRRRKPKFFTFIKKVGKFLFWFILLTAAFYIAFNFFI